jgi:ABC-type transport system involved in multi-copper enzyme maturation permease subunit
MILGPVFQYELLTTSRRRRYYVLRAVYGLLLLAIVGLTYEQFQVNGRNGFVSTKSPIDLMADLANAIFTTFISTQIVAVLCVTPAIVAGTIADEKQRKTLHYLLASELTSREIVVGKLAARMLLLIVFIMVGLPIMSILSLFGGLDPDLILISFLGTISTTFCLASLSIFISTLHSRARDAILTVYALEGVLLLTPSIILAIIGKGATGIWDTLEWISTPIVRGNPFQLMELVNPQPATGRNLAIMAALQVGFGLLFVLLATLLLRPVFAANHRGRARTSLVPRRIIPRIFRRPAIGNNPMLWKECHVSRAARILRFLGLMLGVFAVVFLGDSLLDYSRKAFNEVFNFGYGDGGGSSHQSRDQLQEFLAIVGALAFSAWILGISTTTAAGISSEREDDSWLSLLGTTLTGGEILRGKALGALWRWKSLGLLCVFLWTLGLLAGAIHPLGYLLVMADFVVFSAFGLALGSLMSLKATKTSRAMAATMTVLFVCNVGYLMGVYLIAQDYFDFLIMFCTPYDIGTAPARYNLIQNLLGDYPLSQIVRVDHGATAMVASVGGILVYGLSTLLLITLTSNAFERIADRPRRRPGYVPPLPEANAAVAEQHLDF